MLKRNEKWEGSLHQPTASLGVRLRSNGIQVEVFTKMGGKKKKNIHPSAEKKPNITIIPGFGDISARQPNASTNHGDSAKRTLHPPSATMAADKLIISVLSKTQMANKVQIIKGTYYCIVISWPNRRVCFAFSAGGTVTCKSALK